MLLVSAFFVLINLFHTGLRHFTRVEQQTVAVMLAERKMEEVRAWARGNGGRNFDDWTAYTDVSQPSPEYSGFRVAVRSAPATLKSSVPGFEDPYPAGDQRVMPSSARKVEVTTWWDGDRKSVRLVSLVADPLREWHPARPIEVTPVSPPPDPLPRDAEVEFRARGYDAAGRAIPDLFFAWYVRPVSGNGTLTQSRDGSTARFRNVVVLPYRPPIYTGQSVMIQARAVYGGVERVGEWGPLPLQP
ncbi:MAG: hypothetical protein AB1758_01175 [Candidatus Eremiobacterota bacterium]